MDIAQSWTGRIAYRDAAGALRGHESFAIHETLSGRLLHADCEIRDRGVKRSVTYAVSPDFAPLWAHVAVARHNETFPTALFAFSPTQASLTLIPSIAPSLVAPLAKPLSFFGAHPIVMDGWIPAHALLRLKSDIGSLDLSHGMTSSVEHDGASAPDLHRIAIAARAEGKETVETQAGRFSCHRVAMSFGPEFATPHPPYLMWVSDTPQRLLVRAEIPSLGRSYTLEALSGPLMES